MEEDILKLWLPVLYSPGANPQPAFYFSEDRDGGSARRRELWDIFKHCEEVAGTWGQGQGVKSFITSKGDYIPHLYAVAALELYEESARRREQQTAALAMVNAGETITMRATMHFEEEGVKIQKSLYCDRCDHITVFLDLNTPATCAHCGRGEGDRGPGSGRRFPMLLVTPPPYPD